MRKTFFMMIALICVSFICLNAQESSNVIKGNLLKNNGFEKGTLNMEKPWLFIGGWKAGGGSNLREVIKCISLDSKEKLSGKRSLKVNNLKVKVSSTESSDPYTERNWVASVISTKMPLKAGKTYTITFWAKGSLDAGKLKLETTFDTWYKEQPYHAGARFFKRNRTQLTKKWGKYSFKIKAPGKNDKKYDPGRTTFYIQFLLFGKGIAWIDNVTVKIDNDNVTAK